MEVYRREVQRGAVGGLLLRGEQSPDLPLAELHGCARLALRHIVLGVTSRRRDPPALPRHRDDVLGGVVLLEVEAILLIVD